MDGTTPRGIRYRFGPFELDPGEGSLSRNGIRIRLQDLPYRLLLMLVERPGEIITREEVRQHIWPENTFVEFDNSLAVAIRKVRESLNDNAEAPTYVATLPRRGYRFVASVVVQRQQTPPGEKPPLELPPSPLPPASPARTMPVFQPHWGYWVVAGVVLVLGVAAVSLRFHFKPPYISSDTNVTAGVACGAPWPCSAFATCPAAPRTTGSHLCFPRCWTQSWAHAETSAWFREKT